MSQNQPPVVTAHPFRVFAVAPHPIELSFPSRRASWYTYPPLTPNPLESDPVVAFVETVTPPAEAVPTTSVLKDRLKFQFP
jgi:hypothetical protein